MMLIVTTIVVVIPYITPFEVVGAGRAVGVPTTGTTGELALGVAMIGANDTGLPKTGAGIIDGTSDSKLDGRSLLVSAVCGATLVGVPSVPDDGDIVSIDGDAVMVGVKVVGEVDDGAVAVVGTPAVVGTGTVTVVGVTTDDGDGAVTGTDIGTVTGTAIGIDAVLLDDGDATGAIVSFANFGVIVGKSGSSSNDVKTYRS